jgi:hypothetical protein
MESRSFSGKMMRPAPEVHIESDGSFGAIVTPWGARSSVKRTIETLSDFILSAKNDMEATSPFQKLTCLSGPANTLRAAVMLTNDILYREENKNEYLGGIELLAFSQTGHEISFVQVGQPQILLHRKNTPLILIGPQFDLSIEWSRATKPAPPLPQNILGLHRTSNFSVTSFKPLPGDEFLLISRSRLPAAILQLPSAKINVDEVSRILAADDPDQPFWVGLQPLGGVKTQEKEEAA